MGLLTTWSAVRVRPGEPENTIASYHPSNQNTATGKLTAAMFEEVFLTAKRLSE